MTGSLVNPEVITPPQYAQTIRAFGVYSVSNFLRQTLPAVSGSQVNAVMRTLLSCWVLLVFCLQCAFAHDDEHGIWIQEYTPVEADYAWLDQQNDKNTNKASPPWTGIYYKIEWGELYARNGDFDFSQIINTLNECHTRNTNPDKDYDYKIIMMVSDKVWSFESPYKAPLPPFLDPNRGLDACDFTIRPRGDCNDPKRSGFQAYFNEPHRFGRYTAGKQDDASTPDVNEETQTLERYFAKRWSAEVQKAWRDMWPALANAPYNKAGDKIKDHPVLHAIIAPESSNGFPGQGYADAERIFGYPGGQWMADHIVETSADIRKLFPKRVRVISAVNWVFPSTKSNYDESDNALPGGNPNLWQHDVAEGLLSQGDSVGWWAQDLVYGVYFKNYRNWVYPQLVKFAPPMRYAAITGESHRAADRVGDSISQRAPKLLRLTQELGVNNLVILSRGRKADQPIYDLIERAKSGEYPFLKSSDNE